MTKRKTTPDGAAFWNLTAHEYQKVTHISTSDFHYGPLLPGDSRLALLPANLNGKRCLDAGAGAAQNSIYLASRGANCTCIDISHVQLEHAHRLAQNAGITLATHCCSLDHLETLHLEPFDLIFSIFALPFVTHPAHVIAQLAGLLRPGGTLLLSTMHPLAQCEWVELPGEGMATLVKDYYAPPCETRRHDLYHETSRAYPVCDVVTWLTTSGLFVDRLLEPKALSSSDMHQAPYQSEVWQAHQQQLAHIPIALIIRAVHP